MLTKGQFDVLYYLISAKNSTQRSIAEKTHYSLGKVNSIVNELKNNGYIDETHKVSDEGFKALDPYKVDNAIIMAAGMSSRFVPLSIERPKGLLVVKDEILIERQIEQLMAAGISDITVVLGYKKEAFFYLEDKYNVKLLINPLYNVKNNIETLFIAKDELKNTYICSSDDYFSENVFEQYVYQSYYSAVHVFEKTNEWYMIPDDKGNVKNVKKSGKEGMIMLGHVYWNAAFSKAFRKLIEEHHELGDYDDNLWEDLFADNIKQLPPMYIREFGKSVIHEFDSLEELRAFDECYVKESHSTILTNISRILKCKELEICNIKPIKEGLTNTSFEFEVNGQKYVYRHPGEGTEKIINRKNEKRALEIAKELEVDPTYIYMDEEQGWKISFFVGGIRVPDYDSFEDSIRVIDVMKKLHKCQRKVGWTFEPWEEACKIEKLLKENSKIEMPDFEKLKDKVKKCYEATIGDGIDKCFCHCDTYAPNWMLTEEKTILIDWEYAGNADPGCDVGGYIMDACYDIDKAKRFIEEYLECKDQKKVFHYMAYVAIISYYWFVWALYREYCGGVLGESLHTWYVMAKRFSYYLDKE